jgi:hypothetical protein
MKNKNINSFVVLWFAFAFIFFSLGLFHSKQATQSLPKFELKERPLKNVSIKIKGLTVDEPLEIFTKDFNEYIEKQNKSSRWQNIAAAIGYFVSFFIAIWSAFLNMWWFKKRFTV